SRCRRRLQAWYRAGIWHRLHALLRAELQGADKIDWSRAAVDSSFVRARGGGEKTGPSPVDRRKKGGKHHAVVDAHGIPLATTLSAANAPDVTQLEEVVEAIPEVRGKPGRPRRRPDELLGTPLTTVTRTARRCGGAASSRSSGGGSGRTGAGWGKCV